MFSHCLNCLVHHQIRIRLKVLLLYTEEVLRVKVILFQKKIYLIKRLLIFLSKRLQLLQCFCSFVSEQITSNMTLNFRSHLVALCLSNSFPLCFIYRLPIAKSAKPTSNIFLNQYHLFYITSFQQACTLHFSSKHK